MIPTQRRSPMPGVRNKANRMSGAPPASQINPSQPNVMGFPTRPVKAMPAFKKGGVVKKGKK